jgi:urocanate hydratase
MAVACILCIKIDAARIGKRLTNGYLDVQSSSLDEALSDFAARVGSYE